MLDAQRLSQVGSSLSADGVHPELRSLLYQIRGESALVISKYVRYLPTQNISRGFRRWPKKLSRSRSWEARVWRISRQRRRVGCGNSMASALATYWLAHGQGAATRSDTRMSWYCMARRYGSDSRTLAGNSRLGGQLCATDRSHSQGKKNALRHQWSPANRM